MRDYSMLNFITAINIIQRKAECHYILSRFTLYVQTCFVGLWRCMYTIGMHHVLNNHFRYSTKPCIRKLTYRGGSPVHCGLYAIAGAINGYDLHPVLTVRIKARESMW